MLAVVDMVDRIGIGQHGDDDFAVLGKILRRFGLFRAGVGQRLRLVGGAIPYRDGVADFHQARRHCGAHAAEPGNSDLHERPPSLFCPRALETRAREIS